MLHLHQGPVASQKLFFKQCTVLAVNDLVQNPSSLHCDSPIETYMDSTWHLSRPRNFLRGRVPFLPNQPSQPSTSPAGLCRDWNLLTEYRSGAGVLGFCITMNPINGEDWISSAGSWVPRNPGIWRWPHSVPTRTLTLALHTCLAAKWIFFRALLYLWLSPEPSPLFSLASGERDKSLFRCYKEGLWLTF